MRRTLASAALLPLVLLGLAACSHEEDRDDDEQAGGTPTAQTREESWSQLFEEVNTDLQADRDLIAKGADDCRSGDHDAKLVVERRNDRYVYGFGTACALDDATAVLAWPEGLQPKVVRGEKVLRTIPAAYAQVLEDRSLAAAYEVDVVVEAAESARASTGVYPAQVDLGALYLVPAEVEYAATDGQSGFRVCVQKAGDGPWQSYSSTRGVVSLGDQGTCSFRPPPAGSLREVRTDLRRLLALKDGPGGFGCKKVPSDAALRAQGVLSKGNRVGGCERISWQEGGVFTQNICVQHGTDGPWAVYDESLGTVTGGSGSCEMRPEPVIRGPYA